MTRKEDWTTCKISTLMATSIDIFLALDKAKRNGLFSRDAFLARAAAQELAKYTTDEDYSVF